TTASTYMVQGVRKGESPLLTTGWTCISSPLATVTIPVWTIPMAELPKCIKRDDDGHCLLVDWATIMKSYIWPLEYSDGQNYIRLGRLINRSGTGLLQQIQPIEEEILKRGEKLQQQFYKKNEIDKEKLKKYYDWVDDYVKREYEKIGHYHGLTLK
ncbi:MAG: acyl-CoA--6-aminopenicillanic acid acyl-transferase, partial [Prevotella sp.]|nr:acyl-CoA--6-aminopenicillanic acid acyl-transferase [Prevotella sp.]